MSKNQIKQGITILGGKSGGIISDASVATAVITGIEAVWIEVLSATKFTSVVGWNRLTATSYTYTGVNIPTSVNTEPCGLGAGYGKVITGISHAGGQIAYYDRIDD